MELRCTCFLTDCPFMVNMYKYKNHTWTLHTALLTFSVSRQQCTGDDSLHPVAAVERLPDTAASVDSVGLSVDLEACMHNSQ